MAKKTRQKKQVTPERLMELSFAYAPPLIISAAAANKVFDKLENGAKTAEEIAKKTAASPRALRILMNALVGLDLLKKDRRGRYSMNQETEGTEFFSQLVDNSIPMSYPAAQKLGDHLKIAKTKREIRILDLAAGSGIWGIAIAQKSPRVRVSAVDWAGMIPTTKQITEKYGVRDRFNFVEGDLLEADFGNGYDIATLGHILHSEGEDRSRKLVKKTFRALKSGGVIAIAEWLVNDQRTEPLPSLMFAVQMLVNTEKGDTFSFNEIKRWLEEAGFKKVRKLEAPGPSPLILATKP